LGRLSAFRMSKNIFLTVCGNVRKDLEPKPNFLSRDRSLEMENQEAIALYRLASCAENRVVTDVFGVHHATVRKCMFRFIKALICQVDKFIYMPNEGECQQISIVLLYPRLLRSNADVFWNPYF
jgi:hypothetical protein